MSGLSTLHARISEAEDALHRLSTGQSACQAAVKTAFKKNADARLEQQAAQEPNRLRAAFCFS